MNIFLHNSAFPAGMINQEQHRRSQQHLRVGSRAARSKIVRANSNDDLEDVVSGEASSIREADRTVSGDGRGFEPILKQHHRNRSRQNLRTAQFRDKLINADSHNGRNGIRIHQTTQVEGPQRNPLGVRQFVRPIPLNSSSSDQNFTSGVNNLMSKIQDMKTDLHLETSNVYKEHPGRPNQLLNSSRTPVGRGKQVIRKGQMQFKARGSES